MVSETEARSAVRRLMERFDLINAQRLAVALLLAKKDPGEYARLLDEVAYVIETEIEPRIDQEHAGVYAALDDPTADWSDTLIKMLNVGPSMRIEPK